MSITVSPIPRLEPRWFTTFAQDLTRAQTLRTFGGSIDVVLMGDSITEGSTFRPEFIRALPDYKIINFGVGGDTTRNVLWRIEHSLIDGLEPKVATLLIGVNDLWRSSDTESIAAGAIACGEAMRKKFPSARLLHYGVFPVGAPLQHLNPKIDTINQMISDATASYGAEYVSMRDEFISNDGSEIPGMLSDDGVHLNPLAYGVWGERLSALLATSD